MKIKKIKNKIYLISTILGIGMITALTLGLVLPIQGTITSNTTTNVNNDVNSVNENSNERVVSNSDFTVKSNDAIGLESSVGSRSMTATTVGPRGFLTDNSSNIVYMGTNGKIIWKSNLVVNNSRDQTLLSSYYNESSKCFIILYAHDANRISVVSLSESNGQSMGNYDYGKPDGSYAELLMYEVQGTSNVYGIFSRHASAYMEGRRVVNVAISSNGKVSVEKTYTLGNNNGEPWSRGLSAGSIRLGNDEYFFTMQIASWHYNPIVMFVYKNGAYQTWAEFTNVNNGWIYNGANFSSTNVTQVWLRSGLENNNHIIHFGFIINGDIAGSYAHYNLNLVKGGYYRVAQNSIVQRSIDLRNSINWNIYNGRFYGNYFYGLLWNDNNKKFQLLKLFMHEQWDSTWNAQTFKVISEGEIFGSKRLTVYNLPSGLTNEYQSQYRFNIYALPIYSSDWNGKQDIMTFYTYNSISNKPNIATNLWILDSEKPSLAYKTRLKDTNQIPVPNVSDKPVDTITNADLENYIRPVFAQYFTQYQDNTTFKITKTANPADAFKGVISATIDINSGYNNASLSKSKVSLNIIFTGFKTFSTTINTAPQITNDLINILPQSVQSGTNMVDVLKKYIFEYVVSDASKLLTIDDIALINVNTYNNLTGTLILESIGLNRWINNQGEIQNSLKLFTGPVVINGLRKINTTALITNNLNVPQIDITAEGATIQNLRNIIFDNRDSIFALNSLPDAFVANDIINISKTNVDNVNGNLLMNFQLSQYYSGDKGTLTNGVSSTFALLIDGFKFTDHGTAVVSPLTSINELNTYPYQVKDINSINVLKHFILENVITKNKTGLTVDNIVSIQLNAATAYDNKNGILYLDSITLNKWYDDDGTPSIEGSTKIFSIGGGLKIAIQGFGRINGFTTIKSNIVVTNDLVNIIPDQATESQITDWINANKNLVFSDLPATTNVVNISNILAQSSIGEISLDITLDSYFDNDILYTYKAEQKNFARIVLRGMKVNNYATFTISPTTNVDKTIITELPQFINTSNDKFKTYVLNNVIQGKKDGITIENITDFQISTYSNLTGSLTLSSITLNKWYDANGVVSNRPQKFENGVTINGFNSIVSTQLNTNEIDSGLKNVLPSNATVNQMRQLIVDKKDEIFAANSIPSNFGVNNIINLNIVNVSNAQGTLELFFIINNWYETSQGRLETSNSTLFSLKLSGFWSLSEANTVVSSDVLINESIFPYEVSETEYSVKIRDYLYSFVLQGNKTNITATNIVGIKLATNPYDNKNGTLKLKSILMDKYYDINGNLITATGTPAEISPANNAVILIKGFAQVTRPTSIVATPPPIDETMTLFNINEVSNIDLKAWVDANSKNIFNQLPINATVTTVNKVLNDSNPAKGELVISITIDQYFDNDETYSYKKQPIVFNTTLSGFQTIVITDTNQNQQAGMPDWSWYLIYGGAGLLGLLLLIWIISAISKKNKRSKGYDDYDF